MSKFLEAALEYAGAGFAVLPLYPLEKRTTTKNGKDDATTNPETIKKWWANKPQSNIGVLMGKVSGIFGIDIDYKDGCDPKILDRLPKTVIQRSPNGGHHAFFKYPEGGIKNNLKLEKGCTVRSDGYYFAMTPSHFVCKDSGKECDASYQWEGLRGLCDGEILDAAEWMLELNQKAIEEKKPFIMPEQILDGEGRESKLVSLAGAMRAKGLEQNEILAALESANSRCIPPKPIKDLERIAASISKKPAGVERERLSGDFDFNFPHIGKRGPKSTLENVKELIKTLGINVRYNVISKEEEILIPNAKFTIDNKANATLAHIISWCNRVSLPTGNLSEFISSIADSNLYNPVTTWIESAPWDGESRLQDLYDTIASQTPMKNSLMRKWLLSAAAAVYEPNGISAHGVLVFRGNQYIGKTKWFKNLAPQELNVLKDGAIIRPDDKDSVFQIVSKWLVELGELDATFRKSDIAQLKAFITKDQDVLRRPYAKKESHYARRTIFFASVNEQCFLNDPTGNRRFWTIDCDSIAWDHGINMQQLWAEVRELYRKGETWYLTTAENLALNQSNESFQQMDPIEEKIRESFAWHDKIFELNWLTATQICQKIGIERPGNQDAKKAGAVARKLVKEKPKTINGLTRFPMPPFHSNISFLGHN